MREDNHRGKMTGRKVKIRWDKKQFDRDRYRYRYRDRYKYKDRYWDRYRGAVRGCEKKKSESHHFRKPIEVKPIEVKTVEVKAIEEIWVSFKEKSNLSIYQSICIWSQFFLPSDVA